MVVKTKYNTKTKKIFRKKSKKNSFNIKSKRKYNMKGGKNYKDDAIVYETRVTGNPQTKYKGLNPSINCNDSNAKCWDNLETKLREESQQQITPLDSSLYSLIQTTTTPQRYIIKNGKWKLNPRYTLYKPGYIPTTFTDPSTPPYYLTLISSKKNKKE